MLKIIYPVFLCMLILPLPNALFAKGADKNKGIIPAAPPVNVYTSNVDKNYKGLGYLQFDVVLGGTATPEFTLGSDEDAEWSTGDNKFESKGLVYVHEGKLRHNNSIEKAWIAGLIEGRAVDNSFVRDGVVFSKKYERSGFYLGSRNTTTKRLMESSSFILDYSFTSMWAFFNLSGNSRIASVSGPGTYVSDYDGNTYGALYRPMLTVQPVFSLGNSMKFIPFAGASAFISLDYSNWELNEWEDELYGKDCFDGCPDGDIFLNFIPVETFVGFDLEFYFGKTDSISLSAFFSAGVSTDTDSMSEVYIVYSRKYD